ncbi:CoA transferase [Cryobacterium sp. SO2]|uniref:CoA transferase n=1 Tax=Cryobacterium sp. SO2 TaxID=1897060 RepID=UPI00223D3D3E|nr:CoA transferase [Cryobacterium sp. SO2]WEO76449.1 CoA transferase [Cryobacterium sp. SO2]
MSLDEELLDGMLVALPGVGRDDLTVLTEGGLPSAFPTTEFASAAVAAAGLAAARFAGAGAVTVDRRLASAWFGWSIHPIGWDLPTVWDAIAGDYVTRDGWLRLHTNAPHHRAAALRVLGTANERDEVAAAVAAWTGDDLERAVVAAGGCAAAMRSPEEWCDSPQGRAVAAEPLIAWENLVVQPEPRPGAPSRPLAGVRVLDLTRVLAGPVATRLLAQLGADVLRIDPPDWDEGVVPEVTLGKRTTRLDLTLDRDRTVFSDLLATADVLVHGYRPGALDGLGFGAHERQRIRPGLIDVALDAYGWSGPRRADRGFDSLVQMSTGIAQAGMVDGGATVPVPLPVQALDHATGYLAAAAALTALASRRDNAPGITARLSLARTAQLLLAHRGEGNHEPFTPIDPTDYAPGLEATSWGAATRLRSPVRITGIDLSASPAHALGHDQARWL